jgi:hypothetical protein
VLVKVCTEHVLGREEQVEAPEPKLLVGKRALNRSRKDQLDQKREDVSSE